MRSGALSEKLILLMMLVVLVGSSSGGTSLPTSSIRMPSRSHRMRFSAIELSSSLSTNTSGRSRLMTSLKSILPFPISASFRTA
jgi:hypothetical protein